MQCNLGMWLAAILFSGPFAVGQTVVNPSFESEQEGIMPSGDPTESLPYLTWMKMPDDWNWRVQGHMNGYGQQVRPDYPDSTWSSDGDWSLYLYAALNYVDPVTHAVGDYVEFYHQHEC